MPDAAEGRGQRVDLGAPGDRGEGAEHRTEADGQHDHGKLRLADDVAQHEAVEQGTEGRDRDHGEDEGQPIIQAPPHDCHVADEGAQHQQVALGEVHQLRCLVNKHEAERDQAVDTADRNAVQRQLQEIAHAPPSGFHPLPSDLTSP